jgi:hypothetical protein
MQHINNNHVEEILSMLRHLLSASVAESEREKKKLIHDLFAANEEEEKEGITHEIKMLIEMLFIKALNTQAHKWQKFMT